NSRHDEPQRKFKLPIIKRLRLWHAGHHIFGRPARVRQRIKRKKDRRKENAEQQTIDQSCALSITRPSISFARLLASTARSNRDAKSSPVKRPTATAESPGFS